MPSEVSLLQILSITGCMVAVFTIFFIVAEWLEERGYLMWTAIAFMVWGSGYQIYFWWWDDCRKALGFL